MSAADSNFSSSSTPTTPWSLAVMLLTRWFENNERADALLDSLPRDVAGVDRARCQFLLFGAIRHFGRVNAHLSKLIVRPPRARLRSILHVAGFELIEPAGASGADDGGHVARVVHHAVEQSKTLASASEARLVNAVVRKLAAALAVEREPGKLADSAQLASWFSHPEWLVQRWLAQFGAADTRALLEWNQRPAPVYARWRVTVRQPEAEWLAPSRWENFFEVKSGNWPAVEAAIATRDLYLQDPSTRLAIALLGPRAGESILDACAAPGGKSLAIADAMHAHAAAAAPAMSAASDASAAGAKSLVVAMDMPGARIDRLQENLARAPQGVDTALVQGDLLRADAALFCDGHLPAEFDAVLLDAPCSNTGVMRHRVDVKWRLELNDFAKHARQQLALLSAAARRVARGGRLVYSTCSIDPEENAQVVSAFLKTPGAAAQFSLEKSTYTYPWIEGHDGASAFLLRRK